jgi:hypothetical protein
MRRSNRIALLIAKTDNSLVFCVASKLRPTVRAALQLCHSRRNLNVIMWNIEQRFSPKAMEQLAALGFAVGSTRGVVRVEKYGAGAEFRQDPDSQYRLTIVPTIMLNGKFTRLWDAGYQKFLLTDDGLKFPALASHLEGLRKFNEELRTALGVPTFYNEAIGSVSQLSVYDRVKGRAGAVPDETVGAHNPNTGH